MSGDLVSEAKGQFAQMLISTLLEYAGYRVQRFGVEESVSEVKSAHLRREGPLALPQQLQCVPDFLVMNLASGMAGLVEVKFRRTLDARSADSLHRSLRHQAESWPDTVAVLVVAEPPDGSGGRYQDYIRILTSDEYDLLLQGGSSARIWSQLRTLGSMFPMVHEVGNFHADADRLIPAIRAWA